MLNLNRIEIIGNLTKDPELRSTTTGRPVTSFAVATNRRYRDQTSNEWVDSPPEFHDVVVWGNVGERCAQVLHKGDRVFIVGRLQTRSYDGQDGTKRYRTEIIADTVIGPDQVNKNLGGSGEGGYSAPAAPAPKKTAAPTEDEINIEDIPF